MPQSPLCAGCFLNSYCGE
ncbi:hypothetical protein D6T63_18395 [Arthrobacter cheniae]|uniref:Uncharacterized protein n=1 Tax=Arthrobacter cheniae TaxID=1258888 RepID=A0A3A5M186_9MICC|nr:hypothetical protein D6T63_18395 [Arthrobacter cheniae]